MSQSELISKYNVPGPRYTSYPTVPFWKLTQWDENDWINSIQLGQQSTLDKAISLYIHLPYCDSLCTFCGCHKHITTNHAVETPYIDTVLKEWELLSKHLDPRTVISAIHLGGGTPTFFAPQEIKRLIDGITGLFPLTKEAELGIEGHPNSTTEEHLITLRKLGFTRISFGIQDYDPIVQQAIHREQTFERVKQVHEWSKKQGFTSISHDLVFGLPKQQLAGFEESISKTLSLRPERVSLYSYAHVPWIKGTGQRGFDESDLPTPEYKRSLYEHAKQRFIDAGYMEIGMDHFALPEDEMAIHAKARQLHRNFMGYTTAQSPVLLGLGMSAISDTWFGFAQNESTVKGYMTRVLNGELPITRGHSLSAEDLEIRRHILNLMCHFETEIPKNSCLHFGELLQRLFPLLEDGLIDINDNKIKVTNQGIPFVRNCCMAFDAYLREPISKPTFSMTI